MDYIVLDLEWKEPDVGRQAETDAVQRRNRAWLRGEITQIGAVRVNEKLDVQDTFSVRISRGEPGEGKSSMSKGSMELADAMELFRLWCGDCPLVIWGTEDRYVLEDNLSAYGLDVDWMPEIFDAQAIFEEQMECSQRQVPLKYAMGRFGVRPASSQNTSRALKGCLNTVKVLQNLSFARGIEAQRWGLDGFGGADCGAYGFEYDREYGLVG